MYALACSPKFKIGSWVTDPDREISRETGSRVGGGDAAGKSGAVGDAREGVRFPMPPVSLSRPRKEFIVPYSCRKTRGRKLSSDQTPGLLLASVDLPQMHLYLAKRNQGFLEYFYISILANRTSKTWIQQNVYDNVVLLDTKTNKNFPVLPEMVSTLFFLKQAIGVWDLSCFLLPSNCTGTFTSCFEQLSLNSLSCIKMMALVQEHDSFFSKHLFRMPF